MGLFWVKIFAFVGILAIFFGITGGRLRELIFRKGQDGDE